MVVYFDERWLFILLRGGCLFCLEVVVYFDERWLFIVMRGGCLFC